MQKIVDFFLTRLEVLWNIPLPFWERLLSTHRGWRLGILRSRRQLALRPFGYHEGCCVWIGGVIQSLFVNKLKASRRTFASPYFDSSAQSQPAHNHENDFFHRGFDRIGSMEKRGARRRRRFAASFDQNYSWRKEIRYYDLASASEETKSNEAMKIVTKIPECPSGFQVGPKCNMYVGEKKCPDGYICNVRSTTCCIQQVSIWIDCSNPDFYKLF